MDIIKAHKKRVADRDRQRRYREMKIHRARYAQTFATDSENSEQ